MHPHIFAQFDDFYDDFFMVMFAHADAEFCKAAHVFARAKFKNFCLCYVFNFNLWMEYLETM